jgi:glycosyltransferase involved in cell wall biosynthesis
MKEYRVLQIIRARAPYLKGLQEAFAAEVATDSGQLTIVWPDWDGSAPEDCLPGGSDLEVVRVQSMSLSSRWWSKWKNEAVASRLPSPALWRLLVDKKPDLIWLHEYSPFTLMGLVYARWRSIPVVVSSEVGEGNAWVFSPLVRMWHGFWGKFAWGYLANCPAARQPLAGAGAEDVVDAFHAVDSRLYQPVQRLDEARPLTFVYVGHLLPRKGLDLLLAAARVLKTLTEKSFKLRLVGPAEDAELRAQSVGLEVEMLGFLSGEALRAAVSAADVFVLPTRQDTYAAVVHEAACMGLPLLVSCHAGAAEVFVGDEVCGFSVEPEDTQAFALQMLKFFDAELRVKMGLAARQRAETLSAHVCAGRVWRWMKERFLMG